MNAPAEGTRHLGRYELLFLLGQGGMGEVHLAKLSGAGGFEKLCIVKTILPNVRADPQFVDRFHHEATVLVHLNHSHIAQVYDMGEAEGTLFMAIEYVPGVDLARVMDRVRAMEAEIPVNVAIFLAQQILEALGYAHRKKGSDGAGLGIVHRDVSPHNVMVSYEGEVKVIDFGLAKSSARAKATLPSTVLGKLGYMSPEQAMAKPVDHRSDIYSAGIVLWEMLTGKSLFGTGTIPEMMMRMARPEIPSITALRPEVSPALEKIVLRALQADPVSRYDRADDFARGLNEIAVHEGLTISAEEVGNYVRAMCSGEYAAERALQSKLNSLAKKKSVVGVQPAPIEGTFMRAPASAMAAGPAGFAPTMAPRSDQGLTPAQKALSQAGGLPNPTPGAFAPTMAPRSGERLAPAPPAPEPAPAPAAARRPVSNVVVAQDTAATDLNEVLVPAAPAMPPAQSPQPAVAAPSGGKGKGLLIAAVLGLVLLAAGGGLFIGLSASQSDHGSGVVELRAGTDGVSVGLRSGKPGGEAAVVDVRTPAPGVPPLPSVPGKTGPDTAPVAAVDPEPDSEPEPDLTPAPEPAPPKGKATGTAGKQPGAPVPVGQVKARKVFRASRDQAGTYWVHTGPFAKLQMGVELKLVGPPTAPGSTVYDYYAVGTVMEVLPRRARLSLSPENPALPAPFGAAQEDASERPRVRPAKEQPVAAQPEPVKQPEPNPAPAPAEPKAALPHRTLVGKVDVGRRELDLFNLSSFTWSGCRLRAPERGLYVFPPAFVVPLKAKVIINNDKFTEDPSYTDPNVLSGKYAAIKCNEGTGYLKVM